MIEAEQINLVKLNALQIEHITNPSEAVQLAAVKRDGYAIRYIRNPSEAVQLAAVERNGYAIKFIENPTEAVQVAAVKQSFGILYQIRNQPCDAALATHLLYHPRSRDITPRKVLDRAEELLNAHCPGLGDVYMAGLNLAMNEREMKTAMFAHLKACNPQPDNMPTWTSSAPF